MKLRPRVVVYALVGVGIVVTIASMIAAPPTIRWRPYAWGIVCSVAMAALVYLVLTVRLRRMVAKVRVANPTNEQILVVVTDDQWTRLGLQLSSFSGVRYAVLDVGAVGIRVFVGVGEPRVLTLIPAAEVLDWEVVESRLGVVTRAALKIERIGGSLRAIVVTPITPGLRSRSSEQLAPRIPGFMRAIGRPVG